MSWCPRSQLPCTFVAPTGPPSRAHRAWVSEGGTQRHDVQVLAWEVVDVRLAPKSPVSERRHGLGEVQLPSLRGGLEAAHRLAQSPGAAACGVELDVRPNIHLRPLASTILRHGSWSRRGRADRLHPLHQSTDGSAECARRCEIADSNAGQLRLRLIEARTETLPAQRNVGAFAREGMITCGSCRVKEISTMANHLRVHRCSTRPA